MNEKKTLNIICAGECMVELRRSPIPAAQNAGEKETQYLSSFAGDVANFAVYLKRLRPSSCVHFLSATGDDALSAKMRAFLSGENIDLDLLARSQDKTVGLYMIDTDNDGERSFSYWRSDSAARQMFSLSDSKLLSNALERADYFYFTGITLAILDQAGKEKLFGCAEHFRRKGKTVIFDPNYRSGLSRNREETLANIERAYSLCNILLSSSEDEKTLWDSASTKDTLDRLDKYSISEIILTNGPEAVAVSIEGKHFEFKPAKADKVVDTTSAGDAFNAGYLAARHAGSSVEESVARASSLASLVVTHPGAIMPASSMKSHCSQYQ